MNKKTNYRLIFILSRSCSSSIHLGLQLQWLLFICSLFWCIALSVLKHWCICATNTDLQSHQKGIQSKWSCPCYNCLLQENGFEQAVNVRKKCHDVCRASASRLLDCYLLSTLPLTRKQSLNDVLPSHRHVWHLTMIWAHAAETDIDLPRYLHHYTTKLSPRMDFLKEQQYTWNNNLQLY